MLIYLYSQQPVDDSLMKVDLMVRYYNSSGKPTALFLLECKRNKQKKYNIEELEEQLNIYTAYLFTVKGVLRNQPIVYGGVAFGPLIRLYQIYQTPRHLGIMNEITPIWGGEPYDEKGYKDVHIPGDACEVLRAFQEIALLANHSIGMTPTGNSTRLSAWTTPPYNNPQLLPSQTQPRLPTSDNTCSRVGPSLTPTHQNIVQLEQHISEDGKVLHS